MVHNSRVWAVIKIDKGRGLHARPIGWSEGSSTRKERKALLDFKKEVWPKKTGRKKRGKEENIRLARKKRRADFFCCFLRAKRGGWFSFICLREATVRFWKGEAEAVFVLRKREKLTALLGFKGEEFDFFFRKKKKGEHW